MALPTVPAAAPLTNTAAKSSADTWMVPLGARPTTKDRANAAICSEAVPVNVTSGRHIHCAPGMPAPPVQSGPPIAGPKS
jgi:hypothetical protein